MERMVKVWGKEVEVGVYQRSKTVWEATGSYLGETFTVKGSSANSAISLWRKTAEYRGN